MAIIPMWFPAVFYRLGVRNPASGLVHNVHTPLFNIDERAIEIGMGMMAWIGASVDNDAIKQD